MRIPIIAGNWKMNTTVSEAVKLVSDMRSGLDIINGVEKIVCPPFVSLAKIGEIIRDTTIKLGAQNVYFEEKGAYTGEISPLMLAGLCEYVILGHSERRQYFNETSEMVSKKVRAVLKAGLKPILCVGERLDEYEAGRTKEIVTGQLKSSLSGVSDLKYLTVAYEPVWAIGTGKAATGKQANEVIGLIRQIAGELYGADAGGRLCILYGGSVTAANIAEFAGQPEIDGALVGGASLKATDFLSITAKTAEMAKTRR